MKIASIIALIISLPLYSTSIDYNPQTTDGKNFAKELMKAKLNEVKAVFEKREDPHKRKLPCSFSTDQHPEEPTLMVFISFSVPDNIWLELSSDLEKIGGVFVLQGIPEQSFVKFAQKIKSLKERGMKTPVQLNPKEFKNHFISTVPTIILKEERQFDRMEGAVSLSYALEKFSSRGDTSKSKELYDRIKRIGI